jgi:hypothetical protein
VDNVASFADHCLGLLKNRGPTGPSGHTSPKPFNSKQNFGTAEVQQVGPVKVEWSQLAQPSGPKIITQKQSLITSVTSGTTNFEQGRACGSTGDYPSHWHAILAGLERQKSPDWMSDKRWQILISDAEIFLSRWGPAAGSLGWTAPDLFGVHPDAPAARFDVMGLIPILNGATVLTLTDSTATMRRPSNAILTYRRGRRADAALITGEQA